MKSRVLPAAVTEGIGRITRVVKSTQFHKTTEKWKILIPFSLLLQLGKMGKKRGWNKNKKAFFFFYQYWYFTSKKKQKTASDIRTEPPCYSEPCPSCCFSAFNCVCRHAWGCVCVTLLQWVVSGVIVRLSCHNPNELASLPPGERPFPSLLPVPIVCWESCSTPCQSLCLRQPHKLLTAKC